ncbi:CLUMA_CG014426, isoform A [Clunio marinus]|uniref:Diacylglycerol O-acyltransferase 1 n=1 Tax=Clunio marinus TaxID=568069 RepID=A0A1J1IPB4_9DIPT|nr:CLUMA_CG014426, isoform A [Clunio marinus]
MGNDNDDHHVRLRRTQSVTRAEEITTSEQKQRKSQPDKPIHKPRDSLFSWSSNFNDFSGLVNWGFLLLTMGGIRLLLENFIKYGIRVDPMQWFNVLTGKDEGDASYPSIVLGMYATVPIVICLIIEKGLSVEIIAETSGRMAHVFNLVVLLMIPIVVIYLRGTSFALIGSVGICVLYSILFMKLWSYVQVNLWCRMSQKQHKNSISGKRRESFSIDRRRESEDFNGNALPNGYTEHHQPPTLVKYPDNLSLKDLFYFLCAPTLCYELNFPRTTRIRKRFLIKRLVEFVVGVNIVMALFQQWMIPSVKNSLVPFSNMEFTKATERLLKLAIPNHFIWLCLFYLTFHSFLNLLGEILHFADRNFYCDWWNSNNVDVFWRTWNMPVHRWCVRHLYIPIVDMGYNKTVASIIVFFVSAFFHEYLVSVPLKTFKIWAFMGMMAQIPLSFISKFLETNMGERWGNVLVWASLILGQPLCILVYYHDYVIQNFNHIEKEFSNFNSMLEKENSFDFSKYLKGNLNVNHLKGKIFKSEDSEKIFERNLRLPNDTIPLHYNLRLRTNIHNNDPDYHGDVRIKFQVLEPTDTITIHSTNVIRWIDLFNGPDIEIFNLPFTMNHFFNLLIIRIPRLLNPQEERTLRIEFSGQITDSIRGFYRTSYRRQSGELAPLASTFLHPIFARNVFPCYDEIRYRTSFDLAIEHHVTYNAVSNMPVLSRVPTDFGFITTTFETTPMMPISALAFTISDFTSVTNENENLPMSVWANPFLIGDGRADNGLLLHEQTWNTLEGIFNISFSLPKSDVILIPTSFIDSVNWGLIGLPENWVITGSFEDPPELGIIFANKNAHQYFGNLVSQSSWAYSWLSTGVSKLYENIVIDIINPERHQWEHFLIDFLDIMFQLDTFNFLPPLNRYPESDQEIIRKFDVPDEVKGAIILRMLKEALGDEIFTEGVREYLLDMQYKSASPDDLFRNVQKVYDVLSPGNNVDLGLMMTPWLEVSGFPLLTVQRTENGLKLKQETFQQVHNELFNIPISFTTSKALDFDNTTTNLWMTAEEMDLNVDNDIDWGIFNLRDTSFYLTNYDDQLWRGINNALNNDHEAIHFLNRGTLFADFSRFFQEDFHISSVVFLEMMRSLRLEFHPHVWNRATSGMILKQLRLRGSEFDEDHTNFMKNLMTTVYGRFPVEWSSPWNDIIAAQSVTFFSCFSGVELCREDAMNALIQYLETGVTSVPYEFQCSALMGANETIWTMVLDNALETGNTSVIQSNLARLSCSQDKLLIETLINIILDPTIDLIQDQFRHFMFSSVLLNSNLASYEAVIDTVETRYEELEAVGVNILTVLFNAAFVTNTEQQAERFLNILSQHSPWPIEQEQIEFVINRNIEYVQRNAEELREWYASLAEIQNS